MMFQPEVKLEFVRRYCPPEVGWRVFVDIDPSEEGRTGTRTSQEAAQRRDEMQRVAPRVRAEFGALGVRVGGSRGKWITEEGVGGLCDAFPCIGTDRDIVAVYPRRRLLLIAEVEGESSGQPEQKLYKAIGQIVLAVAPDPHPEWRAWYALVVHREKMAKHLAKASVLARLGISGLQLAPTREADQWLFGGPPEWAPEQPEPVIAHWPGDWPGRRFVDLDCVGDPGFWIDDNISSAEEVLYGDPSKDEDQAAALADAYITRGRELCFPLPTDRGMSEEKMREVAIADFVHFVREWRRRSFAERGGEP